MERLIEDERRAIENAGAESQCHIDRYMMYQKALLFSDEPAAREILQTTVPKKQQAFGRQVKGFEQERWVANRERIVEEGNWFKFMSTMGENKGVKLKQLLLDTGDREIVETSPYDKIWGVGFEAKNAGRKRRGWGLNLLGKAIMKVRARIKESNG
jgi:ribA/ribD-fused uncharacterized protein